MELVKQVWYIVTNFLFKYEKDFWTGSSPHMFENISPRWTREGKYSTHASEYFPEAFSKQKRVSSYGQDMPEITKFAKLYVNFLDEIKFLIT